MVTIEDTLASWVGAEVDHWEKAAPPPTQAHEYFDRLNESKSDIFVFVIQGQHVTILPKPRHYTAAQWEEGSYGFLQRAHEYRQFLNAVVREYAPDLDCRLAMSMDDRALESAAVPVFAFQKRRDSHALLLPDIDALMHRFYQGIADDTLAYDQKINQAVFAGATTGEIHTLESVRQLTNQRLQLGVFFRGNPDVIFNLPNVTQCDSLETEQAIRALGFGAGTLSWAQQLRYRFLLSVDGNGATCSRVAIALKSNSVLLKFDSDHLLYYFRGLQPGRHYLPIAHPAEVVSIVQSERDSPGRFAPVAREATDFYRQYLTREPSLTYTAMLLQRYARLFDGGPARAVTLRRSRRADVRATCLVHVRDHGDLHYDLNSWIGEIDGHSALEGFELSFQGGLDRCDLLCKVLTERNGPWTTTSAATFVGSRSQSLAIRGLGFELTGEAASRYDCVYTCAFQDGTISPAYSNGECCVADDARPIKAFQLAFLHKRQDP